MLQHGTEMCFKNVILAGVFTTKHKEERYFLQPHRRGFQCFTDDVLTKNGRYLYGSGLRTPPKESIETSQILPVGHTADIGAPGTVLSSLLEQQTQSMTSTNE